MLKVRMKRPFGPVRILFSLDTETHNRKLDIRNHTRAISTATMTEHLRIAQTHIYQALNLHRHFA
jgi:hypothetical protein